MALTWTGPLASTGVLTGDRRMFDEPSDLTTRSLPMPLRYSPAGGHQNAVDVGVITHVNMAANPVTGSGFFLPEDIEPLVKPAVYKTRAGIAGPSLDMDNFTGTRKIHPDGLPYLAMRGRMMAATLVSTPAFADQRLVLSDALLASAWVFGESTDQEAIDAYALIAAGVNTNSWQGKPIAPRDAPFSADQAIQRIRLWANGDPGKFSSAFLWQDPQGSPTDLSSYRLPIGDIIDGKLTVIYHAIYAGAALIQGAHGGLPGIGDADKSRLRTVVDRIYAAMGRSFDEVLEPPWDQGAKNRPLEMTDVQDFEITNVDDVATAVGTGFVAGGGPFAPASSVFDRPVLDNKAPHVTITDDGLISGYLCAWDTCHVGIGNVCTTPPHSKLEYRKFHQGTVLTAEGTLLRVGKITMGGGHADTKLGIRPAVEHYDSTSTAVAAVRAYEDDYGIAYAGMLMPGVTPEQVFMLRASALSGDWRFDRGVNNLELIAALAVNTPGFPLVQVASGVQVTLLAAGMALESGDGQASGEPVGSDETIVAAADAPVDDAVAGDEGNSERVARLAAIVAADQAARTARLAEFSKLGEEG